MGCCEEGHLSASVAGESRSAGGFQHYSILKDGRAWAFINALDQVAAVQAIQAGRTVIKLVNESMQHLAVSLPRAPVRLHALLGPSAHAAQQLSLAAIHPIASSPAGSVTQATATKVAGLFQRVVEVPDSYLQLASMAAAAGDQVKEVVWHNGQLVLSGMRVKKQKLPKLPDSEVRTMFEELDNDKNGFIDGHEFMKAFKRIGLPHSTEYLRDVMEEYSSGSADHQVTYEQYKRHIEACTERCWRAFNQLDVDRSGYITEDNLVTALNSMGMKAQARDAQRMIQLLDTNCDEAITFEEFCRFASMLPKRQLDNSYAAFCWADSADFLDGSYFRRCMVPGDQLWKRITAGGVAGAISKSIVAPLERLRTIAMATTSHCGMRAAWSSAWADGGLVGLFKGNTASVIKAFPGTAVKFSANDFCREWLNERGWLGRPSEEHRRGKPLVVFVAGSVSGALECIVTHPMETIRTVMSMPDTRAKTFLAGTAQVWQNGGISALYAGFWPSLVGDVLGAALGFTFHEQGCSLFEKTTGRKPNTFDKGIIGASTSALVLTVTMPLDMIQRRMQVAASSSAFQSFQYRNIADALVKITRNEGFLALYRGSAFSYIKIPISLGFTYALYDGVSKGMAVGGLREYKREPDPVQMPSGLGELVKKSTPLVTDSPDSRSNASRE